MKITVLGDVMVEPPLLKASRKKDGSYDFNGVFEKVRPMLAEADFVIANLEFPFAGEEAGYTDGFYSFNAPDAFADAVKNAGIDLVSTVNNHTLDRGFDGMIRTIHVLDKAQIAHTGSFLPEKGREHAAYFEVDGVKFALVAYTYTTNKKPGDEDHKYINFLRPFNMRTYLPEVSKKLNTWVDRWFRKYLKGETRSIIKMCLGMPNTIARADDYVDKEMAKPYIDQFKEDIKIAKENADFVICYPHIGGQFNPEPGEFSKYVVEQALDAGADAVLASHSHMVQKAMFKNGVPLAYSLGNFSMTANSVIIIKENLPEYGMAFHMYLDGNKVEKVTFSILKAVEKKGEQLVAWPVDELYRELETEKEKALLEKHVRQVYKYIMGKEPEGEVFKKEYEIIAEN